MASSSEPALCKFSFCRHLISANVQSAFAPTVPESRICSNCLNCPGVRGWNDSPDPGWAVSPVIDPSYGGLGSDSPARAPSPHWDEMTPISQRMRVDYMVQ